MSFVIFSLRVSDYSITSTFLTVWNFPPKVHSMYVACSLVITKAKMTSWPLSSGRLNTADAHWISVEYMAIHSFHLFHQAISSWLKCDPQIHISFIFFAFLFFLKFLFIFDCAGSPLPHRLSSSCREWGPLSSCGAWASRWDAFSCCGARALGWADASSRGSWARAQAQ